MDFVDEEKKNVIEKYLNDVEDCYKKKKENKKILRNKKRKGIGLFQNGVYSIVFCSSKKFQKRTQEEVFILESEIEQ